ncbi:MAG: TonB-dependent receptor [Lysobacteraceae bacterium]|nr:MAG: TonB-dependent receptor [Xanthomonadaceae bacterium]
MTPTRPALLFACLLGSTPVLAQSSDEDPRTLDRIRVQATRLVGVNDFDTPASVSTVSLHDEHSGNAVNVSEQLVGIPGLLARDRQNYAQDTQLSIRGFGARSTFGVRGVRLYADGIPATMPDGQGQLSHFNLAGGDRLEVMRGPFSALHGNSSGGVLQLWSAEGEAPDQWRIAASSGSDASRALSARLLGKQGSVGYNVAASTFETDGYRAHSGARRDSVNAKFGFDLGGGRQLDLVLNHLDLPDADDPLGLTAAQVREDPTQATPVALEFDTRKSVRQSQAGLIYVHPLGPAHSVRLMGYGGRRRVEQFLALPAAAQANPLNSGGVIDLDNDYGGFDARWTWQGELASRPLELTVGANADRQRQHRQGYENFIGSALGVKGRQRRDERNEVRNFDQFAQAWLKFTDRWAVLAGIRNSDVRFSSQDDYVTAANPDDSGRVSYSQTSPVAGLVFSATGNTRFYVSAGGGFETPTFNELGYRADGGAGLAFGLAPAVSRNTELGAKWRDGRGTTMELAVFRADTDDELAVASNTGGRSTYRNLGRARRQGLEGALALPLGEHWNLLASYTWLQAEFRDAFLVCNRTGCLLPDTPVAAGSRIPGVPREQLFARLEWRHGPWSTAIEGNGVGKVVVNDVATQSASGYVLLNLEAARSWNIGNGRLRGFARLDNALDRAYIGSVIVNEGNSRFYEPGPDRSFLVGAQWQWSR